MSMLGSLGSLVLSLKGDTGSLETDLGRAHRVGAKFARDMKTQFTGLLGVLGAVAGAHGIKELLQGQLEAADGFAKMSQKVGISVEQLSSLSVQAKLSGVDMQTVKDTFVHLANNANLVALGVGQNAKYAFQQLGITVKDSNGKLKSTQQLWDEATAKLSAMKDGSQKTGIAMALLGRSGSEMLPLINHLKEGSKEAAKLGMVIDTQTAHAAERFNDNMTRVGFAVKGMALAVDKGMLPTLESLSNRLVATVANTENMDKIARIATTGLKLFATGAQITQTVFKVLGEGIGAVAAALVQVAHGNFAQAWTIIKENSADAARAEQEAATGILDTWETAADNVKGKSKELGKKLASPAYEAASLTKEKGDQMVTQFAKWSQEVENQYNSEAALRAQMDKKVTTFEDRQAQKLAEKVAAEAAASQARENQYMKHDALQKQLNKEVTKSTTDWKALGLQMSSSLGHAIESGQNLQGILKGLAIDLLKIAAQKAFEPVASAFGNMIGSVLGSAFGGGKAAGGPVTGGTPYLVGENGPELFVPGSSGNIVPNGAGAGGISISNTYHIDSRSDRAQVIQAVESGTRRLRHQLEYELARGGSFAGAVGKV